MGIKYFKQHLFIVKTILSENLIEKIWFKSYTLNQIINKQDVNKCTCEGVL
jgi:hypothetical protein